DGAPGCAALPNRQRPRLQEESVPVEKLASGPSGSGGGKVHREFHPGYRGSDSRAPHRAPCETISTSALRSPPIHKSAQSAPPQATRMLLGLLPHLLIRLAHRQELQTAAGLSASLCLSSLPAPCHTARRAGPA